MEGDYRKGINKEGTVDSWLWQALLGPNELNGRNSEDSVDDDDDDDDFFTAKWSLKETQQEEGQQWTSCLCYLVSGCLVFSCELMWSKMETIDFIHLIIKKKRVP